MSPELNGCPTCADEGMVPVEAGEVVCPECGQDPSGDEEDAPEGQPEASDETPELVF